ncbi:MAG: hypothetical protein K9K81_12695, partial [Desulfobacteraceae bacterium]|nr:hypothetical protein [Desulfobacteraceae bacterium]
MYHIRIKKQKPQKEKEKKGTDLFFISFVPHPHQKAKTPKRKREKGDRPIFHFTKNRKIGLSPFWGFCRALHF